jgi:uncharacterized protein
VLGDVPLAESVDWALRHGRADGLVLTGRDVSETVAMLSDVRRTDPTAVLIVGGGSQPGNVASLLALADGVIVGSALRSTGGFEGPILADAARAFVLATRHDPG